MPRAVPIKRISAPNCFLSCWAMARAGITWPPVPPPAMMTRMKFGFLGSVCRPRLTCQPAQRLRVRSARNPPLRDDGRNVFCRRYIERRIFYLDSIGCHLPAADVRYFSRIALLDGNFAAVGRG